MGGSHHRLVLLCPSNGIKILSQFRELRARCVVDKRGRIMGRWAISAACAPCPTNLLPNAPPSFILPPPSAPAKPQPRRKLQTSRGGVISQKKRSLCQMSSECCCYPKSFTSRFWVKRSTQFQILNDEKMMPWSISTH